MASRERKPRKRTTGTTRMDAALDAMRQFGFGTRLTRETVEELLDVYGGTQGWPFIEETSYKLLIETLLSKQEVAAEKDKDGERGDGVNNVTPCAGISDVGPSCAGISDVGSSGLVSEITVLHTGSDAFDLTTQSSDQGDALLDNLEIDVGDLALQAAVGGPEQGTNKSKNEQKSSDHVKGINDNSTIVNKVKSPSDKALMIQSSKAFNPLPSHKREGYYGWIGNGGDEDKEYVHFPIPPLSEQIEKMIGQYEAPRSGSSRRRRCRWDEKPECK
ncbi:uncharacterized protein LOC114193985 [Vigna unguiculata]|uniref:uncharacterized protein LOC114193985 n=1 Tax=Vigna unguiculata TaxID=3917 RepID=UPI001015E033|nr:uncharacterized protein LOC114193985 [Vigna unguiculata]